MGNIDRQRIAAVRKLKAMGYVFRDHEWTGPAMPPAFEADALLVQRADALEGSAENSEEVRELAMIAEGLEAYEAVRWPDGKPGREGLGFPSLRWAHKKRPPTCYAPGALE